MNEAISQLTESIDWIKDHVNKIRLADDWDDVRREVGNCQYEVEKAEKALENLINVSD